MTDKKNKDTEFQRDTTESSMREYRRRAEELDANVRRAMQVAHARREGRKITTEKMTQEEVAAAAGISRDALQRSVNVKRKSAQQAEKLPNPNLKTLCAIADALGVPPALLLMGPGDWDAMFSVAVALVTADRSGNFRIDDVQLGSPESCAAAAIAVGQRLGLLNDMGSNPDVAGDGNDAALDFIARTLRGAATGAAIASRASHVPNEKLLMLALFGAALGQRSATIQE